MEQRPNPDEPSRDDETQPMPSTGDARGDGASSEWTAVPVGRSAGETPDWAAVPTSKLPVSARPHLDDQISARPSRGRRALAGAALATGLVVGGAAVAAAVGGPGEDAAVQAGSLGAAGGYGLQGSDGGTTTEGARPDGPRGMKGGGVRDALHGELTVPQADGTGTQVVLVQRGTVTSVSSTRLALKSTDGFTATYPIASSTRVRTATGTTIAGVKVGDTVNVVAAKGGSALMVSTGGPGIGGHHGGPAGKGPLAPGTAPTPGTTPSAPPTSGSTTGTSFDGDVTTL